MGFWADSNEGGDGTDCAGIRSNSLSAYGSSVAYRDVAPPTHCPRRRSRGGPADLLAELQTELADARERRPEDRHAVAIQQLVERFDLSVDRRTELLAALEAQPFVTREHLLRQAVEAWRERQRAEFQTSHHEGGDG